MLLEYVIGRYEELGCVVVVVVVLMVVNLCFVELSINGFEWNLEQLGRYLELKVRYLL